MRGTAYGWKSVSNVDQLGLAPTSGVMANAYDVPRQKPVRASRERRGATPNGRAMVLRSTIGAERELPGRAVVEGRHYRGRPGRHIHLPAGEVTGVDRAVARVQQPSDLCPERPRGHVVLSRLARQPVVHHHRNRSQLVRLHFGGVRRLALRRRRPWCRSGDRCGRAQQQSAACERLVVHKSSSLASEGIQHDRGAGSWSPTQTLVN